MSTEPAAVPGESDDERQHVVHVRGARRAKLTPAPGTTGEPVAADDEASDDDGPGPNDERMRREKPPHY